MEPTRIEVHGFTHGGEGVARLPDGMAVFVPGALPDEVVEVDVVEKRKRFARAELLRVVDPSPDRTAPPCPYAEAHVPSHDVPTGQPGGSGGGGAPPEVKRTRSDRSTPAEPHGVAMETKPCGGCDLQHVTPDGQLGLKTRVVREQLERIGKVTAPPVRDALAVGPATGYRNHARLHAAPDGRLGFHAQGTNEVVPVDPCLVLAPTAAAVLDAVRSASGIVGVEVRGHDRTGARAAVLEPGPGGLDLPDADGIDLLLRQPDGTVLPFRGTGELSEVVAGRTYRFDATCFFQGNTAGADALVEHVLAAVGDVTGALTWDLYAGVGLFALPLAAAGADVVAVEGHATSARWCGTNADDAGLPVDVHDLDVAAFVRDATAAEAPDVVVLDPPRTGSGHEVVDHLARHAPETIVYVACDPASLARDVGRLAAADYRLVAVQPLDLFPMTHHVEAVATLRR